MSEDKNIQTIKQPYLQQLTPLQRVSAVIFKNERIVDL